MIPYFIRPSDLEMKEPSDARHKVTESLDH